MPGGAQETIETLTADLAGRRARRPWTRTVPPSPTPASPDAWDRVVALVVQPGVEFDHVRVFDYDPQAARDLSAVLDDEPGLVFEAHSTDYQTPDGARRARARPLGRAQGRPRPDLRAARGAVRARGDRGRADPGRATARGWWRCSSRRCSPTRPGGRATTRATPEDAAPGPPLQLQRSVALLLARPRSSTAARIGCSTTSRSTAVPLPLLSQHLPDQYGRVRAATCSRLHPRALVVDHVRDVLRDYAVRLRRRRTNRMTSLTTAADLTAEIAQQPRARSPSSPSCWRSLDADRRPHGRRSSRRCSSRDDLRIVLTGAGTSAFAGQILAPGLTRRLRRRVDAVATTDLVANPRELPGRGRADAAGVVRPVRRQPRERRGRRPRRPAAHRRAATWCSPATPTVQLYRAATARAADGSALAAAHAAGHQRPWLRDDLQHHQHDARGASALGAVARTSSRLADAAERVLPDLEKRAAALVGEGADRYRLPGQRSARRAWPASRRSSCSSSLPGEWSATSTPRSASGTDPRRSSPTRTVAVVYLSNDAYTRRYDLDIARRAARGARPTVTW